jgi:osmotically-inducible protein OsmY
METHLKDELLYGNDLVEAADDCLRHLGVSDVSCEYGDGTLFLRGQVPSYYHKQQIQEAVIGIKGVAKVRNEVAVVARPR